MRGMPKYQALVGDKIYIGGAADVEAMIENEQVDVIVDLRGESRRSNYYAESTKFIYVPLSDSPLETEEILYKKAIDEVVGAYKAGKKVGFHCGGGRGRAGTVAVGTLLALGICRTVNEAERKAISIRPIIQMSYVQKESLLKLFPNE
jgi:protein-tyrosine phosphatase